MKKRLFANNKFTISICVNSMFPLPPKNYLDLDYINSYFKILKYVLLFAYEDL